MMSWKKLPWNWKAGLSGIRKSSSKSRSAPRIRNNSATKRLNAKDAEVFAEDAEENFFATFAENLASFAFQIDPSLAFCLLPTAFCVLPAASCLLSKRNAHASSSTDTGSLAFTVTNAAAEFASMGRGDFVSWAAIGSHPRDRADRIWRDLVCD